MFYFCRCCIFLGTAVIITLKLDEKDFDPSSCMIVCSQYTSYFSYYLFIANYSKITLLTTWGAVTLISQLKIWVHHFMIRTSHTFWNEDLSYMYMYNKCYPSVWSRPTNKRKLLPNCVHNFLMLYYFSIFASFLQGPLWTCRYLFYCYFLKFEIWWNNNFEKAITLFPITIGIVSNYEHIF